MCRFVTVPRYVCVCPLHVCPVFARRMLLGRRMCDKHVKAMARCASDGRVNTHSHAYDAVRCACQLRWRLFSLEFTAHKLAATCIPYVLLGKYVIKCAGAQSACHMCCLASLCHYLCWGHHQHRSTGSRGSDNRFFSLCCRLFLCK